MADLHCKSFSNQYTDKTIKRFRMQVIPQLSTVSVHKFYSKYLAVRVAHNAQLRYYSLVDRNADTNLKGTFYGDRS